MQGDRFTGTGVEIEPFLPKIKVLWENHITSRRGLPTPKFHLSRQNVEAHEGNAASKFHKYNKLDAIQDP